MSKPARKPGHKFGRTVGKNLGNKSASEKTGSLRIIGGKWRGRKLPVLHAEGLRPTTDRVRETLFNWLQFELADTQVLDLFAGSGALGLEALSRGARHVTFVERYAPAAKQLQANLVQLSAAAGTSTAAASQLLQMDAIAMLQQRPPTPYQVVFIDPPFRQQLLTQVLPLLMAPGWLAPGAWIYVETEREWRGEWPASWRLHREKEAGQVSYRLFQHEDVHA